MNAPLASGAWTDANQRLMLAEFARLKHALRGDQSEDGTGDAAALVEASGAARAAMPAPAAIDQLAAWCPLSAFERDIVLLAAGVELDAQLAALCEAAPGETGRHGLTFGLALGLLDAPHWSALAPDSPLRRWRLVEVDDSRSLTRGRLRIDERILHQLSGVSYLDVRLRGVFRPHSRTGFMPESHRAACSAVIDALQSAEDMALCLVGDDPGGQAEVAASVAAAYGLTLFAVDAERLPPGLAEIELLLTLWEREAMLLGAAVIVCAGATPLSGAALRFVEGVHGMVFVSAAQAQSFARTAVRFHVDKPGPGEQKALWQRALGDSAAAAGVGRALDVIVSQFRLSAQAIWTEASRMAPALAASASPADVLREACRSAGRAGLDELAQHIDAGADWQELILPDTQKDTLRQVVAHVRNRLKVHDEWGFGARGTRGLGIAVLFAGESGTGKTMAAEVLARELRFDLYRIDLATVVSKYIGETEKNLRRVFDAAEEGGAILLFDEADALFGKRSEVKDSHDRYANIEVSYLLQRMESYRGLAILTSNLKAAIDTAFQRRLRFVVHFPFPDQVLREAIWRSAFPANTPCAVLDYVKLARLGVTGGVIRNIALDAAFRAAELDQPVSMAHLLHAAHLDAGKRERPLSDAETRGWA